MTCAPWSQTVSGTAVDLLEPQRDQIRLGDIAHSLARIARYNGHTNGSDIWSVIDHSLLVLHIVEHEQPDAPVLLRLAALLHDAHEPYIGDITSPMKGAIEQAIIGAGKSRYLQDDDIVFLRKAVIPGIAAGIQAQIHAAFGLPWPLPADWDAAVKAADLMALSIERRDLMAPCEREWDALPQPLDDLSTWPWVSFSTSEANFLDKVNALIAEFHHLPTPPPVKRRPQPVESNTAIIMGILAVAFFDRRAEDVPHTLQKTLVETAWKVSDWIDAAAEKRLIMKHGHHEPPRPEFTSRFMSVDENRAELGLPPLSPTKKETNAL